MSGRGDATFRLFSGRVLWLGRNSGQWLDYVLVDGNLLFDGGRDAIREMSLLNGTLGLQQIL